MLDYSRFRSLLWGHKYVEAVAEARRLHFLDVADIGPVQSLAKALLAAGEYVEALSLYAQVDASERSTPRLGGPASEWPIWISCLHWMLGNRVAAIQQMSQVVDGILDGSIEFADAAGGVQQGLLLHYMGVMAHDENAVSKAINYLGTRAKRRTIALFPGPVAQLILGQTNFGDVLAAATKGRAHDVAAAMEISKTDLLSRRWLCVALFHDGVVDQAGGDAHQFQNRMRQCFSLENPLLEPEWYLAKYEMESLAANAA